MEKQKKWMAQLRAMDPKKKSRLLITIILAAAILAIYLSTLSSTVQQTSNDLRSEAELEERLSKALSKVAGAGRVEVVIRYLSTPELVPALSNDTQTSTQSQDGRSASSQSERSGVISSGSSALILREDSPEVCGVLVVAEGAEEIGVRVKLLNAVTTLLDVKANQVEVLEMQAGK